MMRREKEIKVLRAYKTVEVVISVKKKIINSMMATIFSVQESNWIYQFEEEIKEEEDD